MCWQGYLGVVVGGGGNSVKWSIEVRKPQQEATTPMKWSVLGSETLVSPPVGIYGYAMWGIICHARIVLEEHQSFMISRVQHNC